MIVTLAAAIPAILLQAAPAAPPAAAQQQTTEQAVAATKADGTTKLAAASGEATDKNHPDYVRCRSERVIGSLAKRKKTCMTNREWEEAARTGNRGARDIVESQQVGMNGQ